MVTDGAFNAISDLFIDKMRVKSKRKSVVVLAKKNLFDNERQFANKKECSSIAVTIINKKSFKLPL